MYTWSATLRDPGPVSEVASLHKTVDFTGRSYLVLSVSNRQQLWLITTTLSEEGKPLSFGAVTRLEGVQALPIKGQPFLVVFDGRGGLSLHSGPYKVMASPVYSISVLCKVVGSPNKGHADSSLAYSTVQSVVS